MKKIKVSDQDNIQFGKLNSLSINSMISYNRGGNESFNKGYIFTVMPSYCELSEEEREIIQKEIKENNGLTYHNVYVINDVDCCGCTTFNKEEFDKKHNKSSFSLNDILSHVSANADCHCKLEIEIIIKTMKSSKDKERTVDLKYIDLKFDDELIGSEEEMLAHTNRAEEIASKLNELKL